MKAHLASEDDALVTVLPLLARVANFKELLRTSPEQDFRDLRDAEGAGRPLGTAELVVGLEALLGRKIARRAPGRKPATSAATISAQIELL